MRFSLKTLKRGLVLGWAAWLTVVFLTNLFELLKVLNILPESWAFASGNFGFIQATTAIYTVPDTLNLLLFVGVVVWEALAALLLWRAFAGYSGRAGLADINTAFAVSLALWVAFMLADELLMAYDIEATHMRIFTSQIVTLLAIHLLPDGE